MLSKLRKMKAIHNCGLPVFTSNYGVVMLSKLRKMKAIHNHSLCRTTWLHGVVMLSKLRKMKAIHNHQEKPGGAHIRCCDVVKVKKNESHSQHQVYI